jgi:8-oxo-dGTP diphosphatase
MSEEERKKIKPCVGVLIFKDGKTLLHKRKGSHGSGEYCFTGGHLEYNESFEDCARRETFEEAGIKIKNIKFLCLANYCKHTDRQDILAGFLADWESGEPTIMEPDKCEGWDWYDLDHLPSPIFWPTQIVINAYKSGKNFYDKE